MTKAGKPMCHSAGILQLLALSSVCSYIDASSAGNCVLGFSALEKNCGLNIDLGRNLSCVERM